MFLNVWKYVLSFINSRESINFRVLFWKNSRPQADWKGSDTGVFLWVLQNFQKHLFRRKASCEWLLINVFYENKPPAPKRSDKITAEIFVSFGVVVHQRTFVFPSSLTIPRDLCWPIKFQVLCDQTINSP